MIKTNFKGKDYTIATIRSLEELDIAVKQNTDIIQFSILDKEYSGFMYKVDPPKGYMYNSNRHIPYGNTVSYDEHPLQPNEVSMKFEVCFYKAELHGIINDILNNK